MKDAGLSSGIFGLAEPWRVESVELYYESLVEGGRTPLLMIPQVVTKNSIFAGFLAMSMYFALDTAKATPDPVRYLPGIRRELRDVMITLASLLMLVVFLCLGSLSRLRFLAL
ncbi:hypothetical protein G3N56_18150 [Desulfovibrio sulfodismutans]|uniref:Uncharacterized protein n=1 Tax=Desulfolutivibrio sulfodismutans TaxID=63561 RepID=A0A7K3NR91_9BACT|nr:hypothetical protein [Desulfolutivibrio sulfodismutans]NDY58661.1 hypothetical protein [Desulfolutivibrio sulfodismutans]QLA12834.1 hypothetical protein GD606_11420 [Desulfolutivibrio sulfodismutans DSM 3696]